MTGDDFDIDLVYRAKNGDQGATERLLEIFMPMITTKSSKLYLQGADRQDLIQEALVGFIEAIRDYDEEKNDFFPAFLNICVNRQINEAIKKFSRKKHNPLNTYISLYAPIKDAQEDGGRHLYDTIVDTGRTPEEEVIIKEKKKIFDEKNSRLSSLESDVLRLYMKNYSYEQMSKILSKDKKSIDNALQRIKKKLYNKIRSYYDGE